ncbi:putative RNA-directed DNA polymerase from transposon BS [Exaiptasia diaphana]|nr:putative RNA-directed DNA polymerase from transposon BS [Exaiptasia diaphana]
MVSKVIEKVVHNAFLSLNNLYEPFQSAYRPYHSCETALLRISDDILQSLDRRQCVAILFLDLSAAFDTVDHSILLNRLRYKFGVSGSALQWFKSYLSNRHQFVSIDNVSSDSLTLGCGVPQGSVLGPVLYLLYTSPVADILRKHKMSFHFYADDTQIYIPFSCNDENALDAALNSIKACLCDIDLWMTINKLKLNKDKTEFLIFSSKHSLLSSSPVISFGSEIIHPSSCVRNIGVLFDSSLSLANHIKMTCKSSFYHLRNISRIRKFLSVKSTDILVHSFISSKLDNCNSLLYGLPKYLIDRLQAVQNACARLVMLSKKHDQITPLLINLHWLPVNTRIKFKILLLTFKALHGLAPIYVQDMLKNYRLSRCLRSSSQLLLSSKSYNLKSYGYRSFSVAGPFLWNSLPSSIRDISSLDNFKTALKTFLFKQTYDLYNTIATTSQQSPAISTANGTCNQREIQGKTTEIQCLDSHPTFADLLDRSTKVQYNLNVKTLLKQVPKSGSLPTVGRWPFRSKSIKKS